MSNIWLISDTHFGHSNILGFKDKDGKLFRGDLFSSVEEMNEVMIENITKTVKPGDTLYHLGDVFMSMNDKDADKLLSRLSHIKKRLIVGNHDDLKSSVLHKHFSKIMMWRKFKEFDCVLTHVPIHMDPIVTKTFYNIHGHIHQNDSPTPDHINVCVEKTNYTPVNIEELLKGKLNG